MSSEMTEIYSLLLAIPLGSAIRDRANLQCCLLGTTANHSAARDSNWQSNNYMLGGLFQVSCTLPPIKSKTSLFESSLTTVALSQSIMNTLIYRQASSRYQVNENKEVVPMV